MDNKLKQKPVKLLEENTGEDLGDLGFGNECLDTTLKPRSKNEKDHEVGLYSN